jgi:DNA-binding transcriptional regulator YiaG
MGIPALPFYKMNFTVPKIDGFIKNPKTLGDHIRNRRLKLHLFQKDVADLFEVSTDTITNWENNRSVPQIQFYKKIIDFLEFFPFDIYTSTLQGKMKEYRYRNGLSYKEFAKLFGVNQTTILDWEENTIRINSKYIDDLKKVIRDSS